MKKILKENIKLVLVVILTAIICVSGTVFAQQVINANQVNYNNTTVADALDGMYRINSFQTDYSTEEKIVGKWIDGKPLYQKTISTTISVDNDLTQQSTDIDVSSLNIDKAIYWEGFIIGNGQTSTFYRQALDIWGGTDNNFKYIFEIFFQTKYNLRITTNRATLDGQTCYVTIRYTKTTDTATVTE